ARLARVVPGRARYAHERGSEDVRRMRLAPRAGEHIDRSRPLTFSFGDESVEAFAGDTIGSALFASGRRIFSRSFKYHRPRGLLCCSGACPNCLMEVNGVPNVRVCVEPVRAGTSVRAQNVLGSLDRDLLAVVDKVGRPFTPVGFYYRTMIRPRRAWPLYERARRIVVATGTIEQPLLFPGNDLPGIMLPRAVRHLVSDWSIKPGERAVVVTADDAGLRAADLLREAGTDVAEVLDLRRDEVRSL